MPIELNGRLLETAALNLADLLVEQGMDGRSVATALNGQFVPKDQRRAASLSPWARVEVLSPMQGG